MDKLHYDVGIVGFWYGINYGSILTYYALYEAIEEVGLSAILVNKPLSLWDDKFYLPNTLANRFFTKKCNRSRIRKSKEDWRDLNNFCGTFIVGSDVVWKHTLPARCGYHFFLDFVRNDKLKIAYAPSFGGDWEANEFITERVKFFMHRFNAISCREMNGIEICNDVFKVDATQVVDPVFLAKTSKYEELAESSAKKNSFSDNSIVAYVLGPGVNKRNMLIALKKLINADQLINIVNAGNEEKGSSLLGLETQTNLNVEDWLCYIKNCRMYIGDSFHGICFSIIFRKNFILIRNRISPSRCRFDTLLKICGGGIENRSIYADEDITLRPDLLENINYDEVYKNLNAWIESSRQWLNNALHMSPKKTADSYDILIDDFINLEMKYESLKSIIEEIKAKNP